MKELLEFFNVSPQFETLTLIAIGLFVFAFIYIVLDKVSMVRVAGLFYKFEQDDSKEKSNSPIQRH